MLPTYKSFKLSSGLRGTTAILCLLLNLISCSDGRVLLVSFDGFRWRYLHQYRAETSWFWALKTNGSADKVGGMKGTFITKTFPSHVTLATGLYQESHGIVSNVMYDPKTEKFFSYKKKEDNQDPKWWSDGEPIWITAERQGKKSATYFWPGSEVSYDGVMQTFWKKYNKSAPFKKRIDTVVKWLSSDNVQLATLYFSQPDSTGHTYGPNSQQVRQAVSDCNKLLGYLIQKLQFAGIYSSTNILIVSDHGMSECSKEKIIPLYKSIAHRKGDLYDFTVNKKGTMLDFFARKGKEEELYSFLNGVIQERYKGARVYRKSDIPDRFHFKSHRRIGDVLVIADEGYSLIGTAEKMPRYIPKTFGCHGFDNAITNMEPIFIAHGPNISQGNTIPRIRQVDVYNLISSLLNIEPKPNNGSMDLMNSVFRQANVTASGKRILNHGSGTSYASSWIILMIFLICKILLMRETNL